MPTVRLTTWKDCSSSIRARCPRPARSTAALPLPQWRCGRRHACNFPRSMTSALVSAVIPTYNRADLVCRAVDSVLQQSYGNVEAVLVDDGSKDNTPELIATRYRGDDRVRYISVQNGGVS